MLIRRKTILALVCLLLLGGNERSFAQRGEQPVLPAMRKYDSRYYVIHTDIPADDVREAIVRMTCMAEEYHQRTRDFAGAIRSRLPFYLFSNPTAYYATGAPPGSAGVFTGNILMSLYVEGYEAECWAVVQHEGFHQFAHAVIGGDIPIWVNEGLAEYFGAGIFTGDGYVTGVIPPDRLKVIKDGIRANRYTSVEGMMRLSHEQWNRQLSADNYDHAWAMVHFLAHGDDGKYQKAFGQFMGRIGRGVKWEKAWSQTFGDTDGFESRFREFWLNLPDDPTADLYAKARVATLASYLARAASQKQTFDSFEAFKSAGLAGELKAHKEDWLPPKLLQATLNELDEGPALNWSIEPVVGKPAVVVATRPDGTRIVGSYTLRGARVAEVETVIDDSAKVIAEARALIEKGKIDEARDALRSALRRNEKSPLAEDVRKLLAETR